MGEGILTLRNLTGPVSDRRGFSLIEVMVSMAITLTVTMAILGMFSHAYRLYARSQMLTVGTNLAASKLADFRAMTVDAIKAENPKSEARVVNGIQYTLDWSVEDVDVDGDSILDMVGDLVKISLDVSWIHGDRDHSVSMATMTTGKPQ
jgi:prepilin-type N-terminal cleavage/methylation domain-containing protein